MNIYIYIYICTGRPGGQAGGGRAGGGRAGWVPNVHCTLEGDSPSPCSGADGSLRSLMRVKTCTTVGMGLSQGGVRGGRYG